LLTALSTDPREGIPNMEVTVEPNQEPNQNDNRQESNTVENRGSDEDGILQPQDMKVEEELTDLQR